MELLWSYYSFLLYFLDNDGISFSNFSDFCKQIFIFYKKNAEIFGKSKKKQYLCTRFREEREVP